MPSSDTSTDHPPLHTYARQLQPRAEALGVSVGEPRWTDDDYAAKLELAQGVPIVSFTFGCPSSKEVARLQAAGSRVLVTVTSLAEARAAAACGADAVCVQGREAGAHQGTFLPQGHTPTPLDELLRQIRGQIPGLQVMATGGLMSGQDIARVLALGASAAQLGTAFLLCPEAGTTATHRAALVSDTFDATALTRAFTGQPARGLKNSFMREFDHVAPPLYPQVHYLTRPLRVAAAQKGDFENLHLWAGEGWREIRALPAAELVAELAREAGLT